MAQQGLPNHVVTAMAVPPSNATLVSMSRLDNIRPTWVKDKTTAIWTKGLSDCVAVATYNMKTHFRSLTHLPGGQFTPGWAQELAAGIDKYTIVIVVNGTAALNLDRFHDSVFVPIMNAIKTALKGVAAQYWMYCTPLAMAGPGQSNDMMMDSFVLLPDGTIGRAGGPTSVTAKRLVTKVQDPVVRDPSPAKGLKTLG
jgi:hypothetical protein